MRKDVACNTSFQWRINYEHIVKFENARKSDNTDGPNVMIPPAHLFVIKMRAQNVLLHEKIIREGEREREGVRAREGRSAPFIAAACLN